MKKTLLPYILILTLTIAYNAVFAQTQEELNIFNKEKLKIQQRGMAVLGLWSVANIGIGIAGYSNTEGSTAQFHKMNAIWNGVNFVLAAPAYFGARKGKYVFSLKQTFKGQYAMEKIFLLNAGLDAAYVVGGLYLTERSKGQTDLSKRDMQLGYGNSIMLQGGALMIFDTAMYLIHRSHGNKKLYRYLDNVILGYNTIGYRHSF